MPSSLRSSMTLRLSFPIHQGRPLVSPFEHLTDVSPFLHSMSDSRYLAPHLAFPFSTNDNSILPVAQVKSHWLTIHLMSLSPLGLWSNIIVWMMSYLTMPVKTTLPPCPQHFLHPFPPPFFFLVLTHMFYSFICYCPCFIPIETPQRRDFFVRLVHWWILSA